MVKSLKNQATHIEWCHGHEKIGQSGKYQYYKKNNAKKNAIKKVSDP